MAQCRYTSEANRELVDIWTFIANDNNAAADRTIDRIMSTCDLLADEPGLGQLYDGGRSLRMFPSGSYIIFYRRSDDGIEVIHVIHAARDYASFV